jgi:spore protease
MDMQELEIRTDLALELNEGIGKGCGGASGIQVSEEYDAASNFKITGIRITTPEGARALGKPMGNYITTENALLCMADELMETAMADRLTVIMRELMEPYMSGDSINVLVVGLGNREVTCDSLGPLVTEYISVLNHSVEPDDGGISITAIAPGVRAQTGMETASIVKGIAAEVKPDVIIAVDALAARNGSRLNTTIQMSDRGIHPGSGVGNHRTGLDESTVGVPVIAVGVPTVIEAATIVQDALENFTDCLGQSGNFLHVCHIIRNLTPYERKRMICEVIEPTMSDMYVTPRDVDASVRKVAAIIARSINSLCK